MITIRNLIEARRAEKDDEGGFTLIELLIVVVVLGILAAIVVFAVQNITKESAVTACRADARTIETAQEVHKAKTGVYADAIAGAAAPAKNLVPDYVKSAPAGGTKYGITTAADGKVMVAAPKAAGAKDFRSADDPCSSAP